MLISLELPEFAVDCSLLACELSEYESDSESSELSPPEAAIVVVESQFFLEVCRSEKAIY